MSTHYSQPAHLTIVQSTEAGMKLDIMHTLGVDFSFNEADQTSSNEQFDSLADKLVFKISPITYNDGTGHFIKEVTMSQDLTHNNDILEGSYNIVSSATDESVDSNGNLLRPAQLVQIDLTPNLEEIYGSSVVASGTYSDVILAVRAYVVKSDGLLLANANYILLEHNPPATGVIPVQTSQVLSLKAAPTPPVIAQINASDNKLSIRFTTSSATPLSAHPENSDKYKVTVLVQKSGADLGYNEANLKHYTIEGTKETQTEEQEAGGQYVINCTLIGSTAASADNNLNGDELINGQIYEVSVSVENETGKSIQSVTSTGVPTNDPLRIIASGVETEFTPSTDASMVKLVETSFGPIAANMKATFLEEAGIHTTMVYWGVADPSNTTEGKYQGISSTYHSENALSNVGVDSSSDLTYSLTLAIPRTWFSDGSGGYNTFIDIQARIGQTTNLEDGGVDEKLSLLMEHNQRAYLVNSESIVFDASAGPLENGIEVESIDRISGNQTFRATITCLDSTANPNITSVLKRYNSILYPDQPEWQSQTNELSLTQTGNSHSGATPAYHYNILQYSINETQGKLEFTASIDDPNGTEYETGTNYKFIAVKEIQVFALKNPGPTDGSSGLDVTIHRMGATEYPRCDCDITDLSANLNGWKISSMDLDVFESNTYENKVVRKVNQELPGILSGQHPENISNMGYNDDPGIYDCEFRPNFTPDGMTPQQETLYAYEVDSWIINLSEKSNWSESHNNTNFFNNPHVMFLDLSGGVKRIQGRTNGSTVPSDGYISIGFIQEYDASGIALANQYNVSRVDASDPNVISSTDAQTISTLQGLGFDGRTDSVENRWYFEITLSHPTPLVPNTLLRNTDNEPFDGLVMINPTDAKSSIGLRYG